MANDTHLRILKQGVDVWNKWIDDIEWEPPDLSNANLDEIYLRRAELSHANLSSANLNGANLIDSILSSAKLNNARLISANLHSALLSHANLRNAELSNAVLQNASLGNADLSDANIVGANFFYADANRANFKGANLYSVHMHGTNLYRADFSYANLTKAHLNGANLTEANLTGSDLSNASLIGANLAKANLSRSNLAGAVLEGTILIKTNLEKANLKGSSVYGISAWDLNLNETIQEDLIITPQESPPITVDNLEVAQFIYLLLNNEKLRDVIDTITSKVVLILGRFKPERKSVLDNIREELRRCNYSPVLFDFNRPTSRDFIETVSTLAHMARFVIADLTDAKIVLEEVPHIVRNIAVPVKPLQKKGTGREPTTIVNLRRNHKSLLDTYWYDDSNDLICSISREIIGPAEKKVKELQGDSIRIDKWGEMGTD